MFSSTKTINLTPSLVPAASLKKGMEKWVNVRTGVRMQGVSSGREMKRMKQK